MEVNDSMSKTHRHYYLRNSDLTFIRMPCVLCMYVLTQRLLSLPLTSLLTFFRRSVFDLCVVSSIARLREMR